MQCKKIIEGLYLGSKECAEDLQFLMSNKFQFVINGSIDLPNYFENHGLHYLQLRSPDEKRKGLFEGGLKRIEKMGQFIASAEEIGMCCLLHCNKSSRSTVFLIGYLMHRFHWCCDKAIKFVVSKGLKLGSNNSFMGDLYGVEQQIKESGSSLSTDWSEPYMNDDELIAVKTYLNSLKPPPIGGTRPNKINSLHISWKDKLDKQDRTTRRQEEFESHKSSKRPYDQDPTAKKPEDQDKTIASEKNLPSERGIPSDRNILPERGMLADRVVKLTIKKPEEKKRTHSPNMIRREEKTQLKHIKSLKGLELPPKNGNHLSPNNNYGNTSKDSRQDVVFSFKEDQREREQARLVSAKKRREQQPEQSFQQEKEQKIMHSLIPNTNVLYDVPKRNSESATDFQFYDVVKPPYIPRPNVPLRDNEAYRINLQDYGRRENFDSTQRRDNGMENYIRRDNKLDEWNRIEMNEREANRSRDRGENRNSSREKRDYVGYKIPVNNYLKPNINIMPPTVPQIAYQYVRRDSKDNLGQGASSPRVFAIYKDRPSSKSGRGV